MHQLASWNSHLRNPANHTILRSPVSLRVAASASIKERIRHRSHLHAEVAAGSCMHLLTYTAVANPLNHYVAWNGCTVVGGDLSYEIHHEIVRRLMGLRNRGGVRCRAVWRRG